MVFRKSKPTARPDRVRGARRARTAPVEPAEPTRTRPAPAPRERRGAATPSSGTAASTPDATPPSVARNTEAAAATQGPPLPRTEPGRRAAKSAPRATPSPNAESFVVREAQPRDLDAILALARHLDSVNLPAHRETLQEKIKRSRESFLGKVRDPLAREYLFVLEGTESGHIAGTSMLFAQHGTSSAPHIYFDVVRDERYSLTLDRHFSHVALRLGFNFRGPTEIGGLVLDPAYRAFGLGKHLSYVRFLFIAMYRSRFRPQVIAELMPPLLPDGRSELWEHLGRHFTGLSYQEADKLSQTNKEFITALFPQTPLYASLLPPDVARRIGEVGEQTKGVRRMLETIGFEYSERIDPFDGGPHFEAETDDITLIRSARLGLVDRAVLPEEALEPKGDETDTTRVLVGYGAPEGPCRFRAMATRARFQGGSVVLAASVRRRLALEPGDNVWTIPF
jgi:arginine N-succinyltransferase